MADKQVALVTGCSTGVGLHTAVRLAEQGFTVVATMRDTGKSKALLDEAAKAGISVEIAPLDVCSQGSIDAAVADVIARHGQIDLLVNNAGAGFLGSIEQTSDADLRRTMEVNFFGVWNTTKAVIAHMRARGSGRIIAVTSVGGLLGQPFNEAYCAAKFAVEGMMEGFAPLAQAMGIKLSVIEPGPINTEFVSSVRSSSAEAIAAMKPPYDRLIAAYLGASGDVFATFGQTGDQIAQIIATVATTEQPDFRYLTSDFAKATVETKVVDQTGNSVVEVFAKRLRGSA